MKVKISMIVVKILVRFVDGLLYLVMRTHGVTSKLIQYVETNR
jgi:hypothetical protein